MAVSASIFHVSGLRRRAERALSELGAPTFPRPGEVSPGGLLLHFAPRIIVQVVRQAYRDRIPRQAASLSFQTLLSAVPVAVIAFSVLTRIISRQEVGELAEWLSQHMLPSQASSIAEVLQRIAGGVDVHALGLAGGLGLFVIGVMLFMNVSSVMNDIWRVRVRRRLAYRVIAGVLLLVFLPAVGGLSVYFAQRFVRLPGYADFFTPLAITIFGLWVAYTAIPAAKVRASAAAAAALVVGLALEAGKTGFGFYVARIEMTQRGLYGAIAFIPLALLWLYVSWLLFLFGVELTYTLQNLRTLWLRDADLQRAPMGTTAGGALALKVMHELYRRGESTAADLAVDLEAAPQAVDLTIDRLGEGGLVEVDRRRVIRPVREAAELPLSEVLGLFSEIRPDRQTMGHDRLDEVIDRLDAARDEVVEDRTMEDLL